MTAETDTAEGRRRHLEPDIAFGHLQLWIGRSRGQTWLDVALRIGDAYSTIVEYAAPLIQRRDLKTFREILAQFDGMEKGEVHLLSDGAGLAVALKRYDRPEANYCNVRLSRGYFEQTISFGLQRAQIDAASAGLVRVMERLEQDEAQRWRPSPARIGGDVGEPAAAAPAPATPPVVSSPSPPPLEAWDAGLGEGVEVELDYVVDGVGWFYVRVRADGQCAEAGGSSWMTDAMGDLLRAGLALLAGAWRTEIMFNAEPGLMRIEFERVRLRQEPLPDGTLEQVYGCWIRVREINHVTGDPGEVEFEALCRSPRHVAEAIYRMAVPHFADHARHDYLTLAALEGALAGVRAAEAHGR